MIHSIGTNVWPQIVMAISVALPIVAALLLVVQKLRPGIVAFAPWTALPALIASIMTETPFAGGIDWFLMDSRLGLTSTSRVFFAFTSFIWLVSGLYAVSYLKHKPHSVRFFLSYLLAMSGNLGLIVSQDAVSFYCFFGLMSFASYGLIIHEETFFARRAGKVYITLVVLNELMIFSAMVLAVYTSGSIDLADFPSHVAVSPQRDMIFALALLGFGVKAGLLPLHVWLPLAHPVAPSPASAVLSACMIKAGLIGWLLIFPLGVAEFAGWGMIVIILGGLAAFYAALVGVTQNDPKTVLAYSSISQMGWMTVIVGAGLMAPKVWPLCLSAILIFAVHHALAKGALFLSASLIPKKSSGKGTIIMFGIAVTGPVLAIAGAPWTSGHAAKIFIKDVLKKVVHEHHGTEEILVLLSISAFATTALLIRFLWCLGQKIKNPSHVSTMKPGMVLPWLMLTLTSMSLPWIDAFWELTQGKVNKRGSLDLSSLGPLIAAGAFSFLLVKSKWKISVRVPAGDILVVYESVLDAFKRAILATATFLKTRFHKLFDSYQNMLPSVMTKWFDVWNRFKHYDQRFADWSVFGTGLMLLILIFLGVLN